MYKNKRSPGHKIPGPLAWQGQTPGKNGPDPYIPVILPADHCLQFGSRARRRIPDAATTGPPTELRVKAYFF